MKILQQLKENHYTESEQQVIDYLLDHLEDLTLLSINDLAKKSYTSNATIIRLCHKVGYQGYRQFKLALLQELEANKYMVSQVDYTTPFQVNETSEQIIQNMFSLYQESIQQVYHHLSIETLNKIATLMVQKKRVFIYGYGDSQITAANFINKLAKLNLFPVLATQYGEEIYISKQLQPGDFALFISYSGENTSLLECMKILNQKGIQTALVTANLQSPLVVYSQYQIMIPDYEKQNKIATFYSQLAFMYILNNLHALIYHLKNK